MNWKLFKKLHVAAIAISAKNMNIFAVCLSLWRVCPLLAFWGMAAAALFRCFARWQRPELAATLLPAYIEKEMEKELESRNDLD